MFASLRRRRAPRFRVALHCHDEHFPPSPSPASRSLANAFCAPLVRMNNTSYNEGKAKRWRKTATRNETNVAAPWRPAVAYGFVCECQNRKMGANAIEVSAGTSAISVLRQASVHVPVIATMMSLSLTDIFFRRGLRAVVILYRVWERKEAGLSSK